MAKATLKRLNGDTTWLIQLPVFTEQSSSVPRTFNLLIDPWLHDAEQVDYYPWFSAQKRIIPSCYPSLSSLSQALAEDVPEQTVPDRLECPTQDEHRKDGRAACKGRIDGILLSHPMSDHAHPESLLDLSNTFARDGQPLHFFGTPQSNEQVLTLFQNAEVEQKRYCIHQLPTDKEPWDLLSTPQSGLPPGLRILILPAKDGRWLPAWGELHSALAILWQVAESPTSFGSIVYSPHGTLQTSLPSWLRQGVPRVLITSFDQQILPVARFLTGPVTLGFESVLSCYPLEQSKGLRCYEPTLIVRTHDEKKMAKGLVGRFIRRTEMPLDVAQDLLQRRAGEMAGKIVDLEAGSTVLM